MRRTLHRPRPTVRLRLTLTYTALFVVTGIALLGVSYLLVQNREEGTGTTEAIICHVSVPVLSSGSSGHISGSGPAPPTLNPADCPNAVGALYQAFSAGQSGGAVSVAPSGGQQISGPTPAEVGRLAVTVKASQAHTLDSLRIDSLIALGLMTVVAFGLSWWIAGRALRPVHRITEAARTLSERTLHARINLRGPNDELKQLADTFDAMLGRLESAFDSQRRFVANASHELRTPLATERVLIDEALANRSAQPDDLRSILQALRSNSEDTEQLIDALLTLARSQSGLGRWTAVELSDTARSVIEEVIPEADAAALTWATDLQPVSVSGDPGLVERLAGNLIENAVRHNLTGGTISVSTRQDAGTGLLEVANTGLAVDPATVTRLVEPFRRAGTDRLANSRGIGLGLSIVDAIVTAHRGDLRLTSRPDGGLHVQVRLPLRNLGLERSPSRIDPEQSGPLGRLSVAPDVSDQAVEHAVDDHQVVTGDAGAESSVEGHGAAP